MILRYAKAEQKNVAYYAYTKDQNIGLNYKHISNHPVFTENTVFLSFSDPPIEMFEGMTKEMLPIIGFVKKLDPNF